MPRALSDASARALVRVAARMRSPGRRSYKGPQDMGPDLVQDTRRVPAT